jgi:hypothetical protein
MGSPVLIHWTTSLGVSSGGRSWGDGSCVNHSSASRAFSRMWALNTAHSTRSQGSGFQLAEPKVQKFSTAYRHLPRHIASVPATHDIPTVKQLHAV